MPEDGCNKYQPNVRNVVICFGLEQLTHWAALTTCKYEQVWEQMPFSFYFATRCVSWINTINQYIARRCSCLEQQHIRRHSLPAWTKHENRWLLVFTSPLDGITWVSWINTLNQYNATRWVQLVAAKSTSCCNLFLFGATDTLGSTHYLQWANMRTDAF